MENLQRWPFDEFGSQKNGDVYLSISVQEVINPRTTGKVRREVALTPGFFFRDTWYISELRKTDFLPSGKLSHNYGLNHHFYWENSL